MALDFEGKVRAEKVPVGKGHPFRHGEIWFAGKMLRLRLLGVAPTNLASLLEVCVCVAWFCGWFDKLL